MQLTITLPSLRFLKWGLLGLLAVALALLAGPRAEPFVLNLTPQQAQAAFPGANGKIAFMTTRDGNPEVYVMNADGSSQSRLTNNAADDVLPAWSSDGTQIAFTSVRDGNQEIYVMNADGSGQTNLSNNSSADGVPAWSPDGTKIAFRSFRDGNGEIYVMNANGSAQTNLTNNLAYDEGPVWSPDGTKIAFYTDRDGNYEVYVMNANGSGQTNLTNNAAAEFFPDWSPDGTKIAFTSGRDGNYEIYTMNANGSGQTNLSNNALDDGEPAWSPDGSKIAFYTYRDVNYEVYTMNANGSAQTNISNNGAIDRNPDWQPLITISIANVASYRPPRACFEVRNAGQVPWFEVCDNDWQGAPDVSPICDPDGTCEDEDPTVGSVRVTTDPGAYNVVETVAAVNHTVTSGKQSCDTAVGCAVTFENTPNNNPWFPWDINGDNAVSVGDIVAVVQKFGQQKPAP